MNNQIKVRVFSVITILSMLLSAVSMPTITAQADAGWTAYNDVVYRSSDQYLGSNVTVITIGTGNPGPTSGVLLDQATGTSTGVTATLTQSGGVVWQADATTGGDEAAAGTDAYVTFHGLTDLGGVVYYGSTGWYVDLTFTGLDPARTYTFATSANRKGGTTYANRVSRYTISDAVTATNASTSGVTITTTSFTGDTSAFSTGENTATGYVARWTGIQPGSDGDFTVRAQADGSVSNAYAFSVFMLQEEATASTPTITVSGTLNPFTSEPGIVSAEQSYSVSGSDLTENIVITAPADFEISTTSGSGFGSTVNLTPSGGTVASTPIYVRFNRATQGTSNGNITHVSAGATTQNVAVSGTASTVTCTPYTEDINSLTLGTRIGQVTGWTESGTASPAVVTGGLAGTRGLGTGSSIFNWSAHPFLWSDAGLNQVKFQMDFQTNGSGQFDDDRLAWMTENTPGSSQYNFGIQLDPAEDGTATCASGQNIETYWRNPAFSTTTRIETTIACLPVLTANAWYRAELVATKLTNSSAKLDVSLTALDASGNPGAVVASGSVADTSTWTGGAAPAAYFAPSGSSTGLYPSYKNHSGTTGNADNAVTDLCSVPVTQYTLSTSVVGNGSITLNPAGGTYDAGTVVQVTAVPDGGAAFSSWSGDLTGSTNPTTITMDGDKSITATFTTVTTATVSFQEGVNSYAGTVDTYILQSSATTSFGTAQSVEWDTQDTQGNANTQKFGLIHFDNLFGPNTGQIPVGSTIDSASLQYTVFNNSTDAAASLNAVLVDWTESTTYNTFGSVAGVQAEDYGALVTTVPATSITTYTIDVTSSLSAWSSDPSSNRGWIVRPSGADGVDIRSSEYTTTTERPKLTVTYQTGSAENRAPNQPVLVQPLDNATGVPESPTLTVTVTDPDLDPLDVTFYGREAGAGSGEDFTLVVIPDTQNMSTSYPTVLNTMMQWIADNQVAENIVFVTSVGDIVNTSSSTTEWTRADAAYDILDAADVPYSVGPGNHDLGGLYNTYFGPSRFIGNGYYQDPYANGQNENNYSFFSVGGMDFILINLQYNPTTAHLDWADALLKANPDRRGIIAQHNILNTDNSWNSQTSFNALKDNPNLFLMLCGHMHTPTDGSAYRAELGDDGHTIHIQMTDYQDYPNGGNGYLRLLRFSPDADTIYAQVYSPYLDAYLTNTANYEEMEMVYEMAGTSAFGAIGTANDVASGGNASVTWSGRSPATEYEWYVDVSDDELTTTGATWSFTTDGATACYPLTLGHTGNGTTPTGSPASSTGCSAGQYIAGETVNLSSATPDSGWKIDSWYGTSNNTSNTSTNSLTMPASALSAGVNYTVIPSTGLVCESFNTFTPGSTIGTYTGWYDGGSGPVVTSGNGVTGSIGLAPSGTLFTWTAHPFDWTASDFVAVRLQGDFQTNASGQFDDDRLAWTINNASTSSDYEFGVQLDPGGTGYNIEAYWDGNTFGDDGGRTSIASLPALTGNAWYRMYVQITKLTATSARLDVTLTALDAGGNPGAVVASGSIADTALLPNTSGNEIPNPAYFTGPIWPNYKNHNGTTGAMDNVCYEVVAGEPPVQYTLTTNTVGSGGITLSPSGGTYNEGTVVQLTATPAVGWAFSDWSGDLTGTTNPASITMDANKTVTATFTQLPPVTLTVNTVGNGTVILNPAGGSYAVGTVVQLSAAPDAGWYFSGWSGDLTSTTNPASITMNANKTVTAAFTESPPAPSGVCESFNTGFTVGQVVGAHADWFDSGTGPVVTSGNGLTGTVGLAPGSSIFTWTAHPFNWNDPAFESINFSMDYQTNASGEFDDDRLGWMTSSTSADSTNFFGVQLDTTEDGGIVTYWRNAAGTRVQTPIVTAVSFTANTWYRFKATFTRLTDTSARIDANLVRLDASGNPTGTPYTGTVEDTSIWSGGAPATDYFTATSMWPAYKNHNGITGAADNTCFDIVSGRFAFVVTTDWHTSDTYPNAGVTTKVGQIADWVNNPTSSMPAPEFMVITGDFPNFSQTDEIINNVLGTDFLWYPVIGNHEISDNINNFYTIRDTVVPALPNIVDDGPTGSENTTYSFDYENAHFVVINPFWDGASNDHTSEGDIPIALNTWVNSDLTASDKTHKFTFIHTPVYPSHRHVGEDLDAPANQARRDAFVATLNANNVESLFAGHTHYYEHDVAPEYPLGNLDQITNGALRTGETSTITYVLVEGSTTTYKVYMWNGSAFTLHEQWSIGGTPPSQPPAAPTTLAASAAAYNQINLTWSDNADNETGFEIERSTTGSGGPFSSLATVLTDVESYSNSGLTAESEYCYRVRAVNAAGESAYSNVACATTPEQPPVTLTCESFDTFTPGSTLGTYAGWYDGGSGPVVTSGNGLLNSIGLAAATNIYTWTAHPFNWNASTFDSLTLQQDFRTDGSGQFDDDRLAWTTVSNSTDSLNQFGVQLDHPDGGIVTYWRTSGDVRVQTPIVALPTLPANTWYRFNAKITKLTATSAQIDVSLTQLDASGNPTGTVYSGSVANTSTWSGGVPATRYFSATTMWPSYKTYNSAAAAPADNACYEVATGEPPQQYTLTVNTVGSGSVALNPAGGTYDEGTVVQLTANPISGWTFSAWSGDLSGNTNPASIVMNSNKTVTATFVQQTGDLVGYWKFDASSGTTAVDSSTYGNNGTVNGATWTTGKVNNGLSFDGTNDYVQIPNSTSLGLSTNRVTIAGWIYPTNISGSWTTIVQRSNTNGSWFDWQLYSRAADAPTANRPVFRVDWNQDGVMDANEQVQGDIILQANTWYYIAATYDGTAMRFYIDGTLRGTTNISGAAIPASNKPVWIGGNDAWGEYFPGRIDEFRIYNRALSQSEIQLIMNPPTCYALTLSHTGTGSNPVASPANSSGCAAGQYTSGAAINLSGASPSTGWQISGWTGTNNNSSTASTNTVTMSASAHTASVNYSQIEYTLTVNVVGNGVVAKSPNQDTYHYGDVVQLTAVPDMGWSFGGWSGDASGTTNPVSVTVNGNKNVTATFTQNEYTLAITSLHGTVTKNPDKATYTYGETVQLTAAPEIGWSFANWTGDATSTDNPVTVTIDTNKSVTANYTQSDNTLTVNVVGSGVVNKVPDQVSYQYGDEVELTAVPSIGWAFSGWSGDVAGTANPVLITMNGDQSATATFVDNAILIAPTGTYTSWDHAFTWIGVSEATWYLLEVQTSGGVQVFRKWYTNAQTGCLDDSSCSVSPAELSLANGDYKWRIMDYGAYGYGTNTAFKNFTLDLTIACYTLTTNVNPLGSGVVNLPAQTCSGGYLEGSVVQLTAVPNSGYAFQDWSGDVSGTVNPASVVMSGNKTITANFKAALTTLTPAGTLTSWDKTFTWVGLSDATWYLIEVQTSEGTQVFRKWYTSAQTNCAGSTNCSVTATELNLENGDYKWRIMDYGAYGYGTNTAFKLFTLNLTTACYSLTTNVNPAGSGVVNASAENCAGGYAEGSVVQLTAVPGTGYVFSGWSEGATGTDNPVIVTMDGNKTVTANMRGNTPLTPESTLTSWDKTFTWTGLNDATWYLIEVQTSEGIQVFRKWYTSTQTNCAGGTGCSVTATELNLENGDYKWRVLDYGAYGYGVNSTFKTFTLNVTTSCRILTVNINPVGSGTISLPDQTCSGGYAEGSVVQITAVPNTGYLFKEWGGDLVGTTNPASIVMDGDKVVTASFKATTVLISPSGALASWNNIFTWTGLNEATWYLLEVYTADGSVQVFRKWYTSAQTGCSGGTNCSMIPPETAGLTVGGYKWRILDYGAYGYGTWTPYLNFTLP